MKFAVLITCFNRVQSTLECLNSLKRAKISEGWIFDIWLNDDGSTDGTTERVKSEFPEVHLVAGSGHDYWCGGMRRVWKEAANHDVYDGFLWLNDDTMLNEDALEIILGGSKHNNIVVGAICGRDGSATYGGTDEKGFVVPDGTWRRVCQMNGNVVWVPRAVFQKLGNFDSRWTHAYGDGDYARTAVENGIGVLLTPRFVGICEKKNTVVDWRNPDISLIRRLKSLYSPLGYAEPGKMFYYCLKHDGVWTAIRLVVSNHLQAIFPRLKK